MRVTYELKGTETKRDTATVVRGLHFVVTMMMNKMTTSLKERIYKYLVALRQLEVRKPEKSGITDRNSDAEFVMTKICWDSD